MANAQGKLAHNDSAWHRDAAIVLREPLRVDPEVARRRIARTLALLTADEGQGAQAPESGIAPPSNLPDE